MYQKLARNNSNLRILLLIVMGLVCIILALVILEKTGATNFYSTNRTAPTESVSQSTGEVPGAQPTNTIDYSAPKPEDSYTIPDKNPNQAMNVPINPELSVVITNTRVSGNQFLIKAVISGTDDATCSAKMSKGNLSTLASSGAAMIESQYSCKELFIPMTQLAESGDWSLQVTVTDKTGASATTNQDVKI